MARSPAAKATPADPVDFEHALAELEQLIAHMESGQQPLDALLTGYQRGAQLLNYCRARLQTVEQQIKVLEGSALTPWEDA